MTSQKDSPPRKRAAVDGLKVAAYSRTHEAIGKIQAGMALVEKELQDGSLYARLEQNDKIELEQGDFMRLCGLGWNFLNGEKHRRTTKPKVISFLTDVNQRLLQHLAERPDLDLGHTPSLAFIQLQARYDRLRQERDDLQDYLSRVLTHGHKWQLDLRQALRVIRELRGSQELTVVPLHRRQPIETR
ncbi:hypothetical protein [Neorhizobium sp. NCHU2750]|uniref:hypothetical protein n=1 Tax=Neorhizobium sp. NCHU2750 TaxID=1825976 RepID=UPI000EB7749F|nr:hypothetical protein NCHU2750_20870 [Neorhizobium sp. NCHU2750]